MKSFETDLTAVRRVALDYQHITEDDDDTTLVQQVCEMLRELGKPTEAVKEAEKAHKAIIARQNKHGKAGDEAS